jgi:exopolyphosphatase/pppGpp-phosphohydrolase
MLAEGLSKNLEKMYGISHKEMAMLAILDLGRLIQNPKKRQSELPKYAHMPNMAAGLSKNLERMYGISHKEMAMSAILDLGRLIQNQKKTTERIAKV